MTGRSERFRPTAARVDLGRLAANLRAVRSEAGRGRPVLAIVKADAYGHGAVAVSRALEDAGVDAFGVALVEEGKELRAAGVIAPILVLGGVPPAAAGAALRHRLTPALYDLAQARALDRAARDRGERIAVHLEIDTGMARLGVPLAGLPEFLAALRRLPGIELRGLFTTLAAGDRADVTLAQLDRLEQATRLAGEGGFGRLVRHAANSAALGTLAAARLDLVRPGLALYGLGGGRMASRLQPVLDFRTQVVQVRRLPAGSPVGYGGTWVAGRPSTIATLAVGYADGLPRAASGRADVLVRGQRARLVGTISMDLATADVSGIAGVRPGDVAVVLGEQGTDSIDAAELAERAGTIPWEILCGIGARVPRLYVRRGRPARLRGGSPRRKRRAGLEEAPAVGYPFS